MVRVLSMSQPAIRISSARLVRRRLAARSIALHAFSSSSSASGFASSRLSSITLQFLFQAKIWLSAALRQVDSTLLEIPISRVSGYFYDSVVGEHGLRLKARQRF